ncbi:hypothetical protein [Acidiluteibacter ferrifornacis]|uniref:Uncharacterized protein n=1 Tax=Acidiluteibacter ferrifornacis TaxID=2692424 RepID=A0A6N9NMK4_9FLAO|nr:hypothetical protein [Acidiluteibacter ferrifornacis]NBG67124.1 hypothetical protein [Acidiluteibacter ferrifornacis]
MSESHPIQIRPRFKVRTSKSQAEIEAMINGFLKTEGCICKGKINHGFGTITIPKVEQHYWSPQLVISIEETPEGTEMRGLYGPKPSIWTMFVFFYATIGFSIIIIAIIGLTNLSLEKSAHILWLTPVLILVFLSLYLTSHYGQKKGHDQLVILHHFIEKSTGFTIEDHI